MTKKIKARVRKAGSPKPPNEPKTTVVLPSILELQLDKQHGKVLMAEIEVDD